MIDGIPVEFDIVEGCIVYPWTKQREENIEYILRCDREVADGLVTKFQEKSRSYSEEFNPNTLKFYSLFNISRVKRYFRSQKQIMYFDAVTRRLWREHEELEEWASDR